MSATEFVLSVTSASYDAIIRGNNTLFTRNGESIVIHPSNGRGFQVVVFDEATLKVLDSIVFDGLQDLSVLENFASYVNEIPTGRIVAVATRDCVCAGSKLPESVLRAINSIGGMKAGDVHGRIAWSFLGRKGASNNPYLIKESIGRNTASVASKLVSVTASSAGCLIGNFAFVTVNGIRCKLTQKRGFNVVVLDDFVNIHNTAAFDGYGKATEWDDFANYIEKLAPNTSVIIAVMDTAASNSLPSNVISAIQSIGGANGPKIGFRYSWAIIGRKGASIGSPFVKEAISSTGAATVSLVLNSQ
ncbi:hypothetical protein BC938DRAFT_478188 [Jimgerdemannia flammicorona]|uniref:ILEI/PANDER domain-containing protein n=1 Tax=Jimgerdemannia flammicorona TaxID=994334 RepID=A0A433QN84_9FUNG|nr:hypothetical protein BC938DRAFT_478188 [Jimgerdemannia flammicorona]